MNQVRWEPPHDPGETEVRAVTFEDRVPSGVTISAVSFTLPGGLTKIAESVSGFDGVCKFSGGTDGTDYDVLAVATLSDGQVLEQTIILRCRSR